MFCSSCGKEILDGAKFCAHCGDQVGALSPVVQDSADTPAPSKLKAAYASVEQAAKKASTVVAGAANTLAMEVGDLNGDGKIDAEDFKIAAARAKVIAAATADEAAKLGKEALQSDMAKDAAAGAAVGAAVAIPIPLIGPAAGAVVGAGLGLYKNFTKGK